MGEFVRLEVEDGVGTIRIDRPKLNAISAQVASELATAAHEATDREDVHAVVLWGGPAIFAAGADVAEMAELGPEGALAKVENLQRAIDLIAAIPKVTIAAINGYALGGGLEAALGADLRYVADTAKLGLPEIQLGVIPGGGGTQRLPRLVGVSRAKELIYSGRHVLAEEALAIGLADRVLEAKELYAQACEDARAYGKGARLALAASKRAIDEGIETDLSAGQKLEREVFSDLFLTEDQKTGMRSLLSEGPGKAVFQGR